MSHTNHTQYYELPQYVGSDIINPLVDTNGAYETIDTTLHNIAAEAGQGTSDIADLQNKVGDGVFNTTAQNATDAVNEIVGELDTAETGIKDRLTNAESDIDTLQSQMVTAQGNITDLQNNKAAQNDVDAINTKIGSGEPTTTDKTIIGAINELDAGMGAVQIVSEENSFSVTADGVKTVQVLLNELAAEISTALANLADNEKIEYVNFYSSITEYLPVRNRRSLDGTMPPSAYFDYTLIDANHDLVTISVYFGLQYSHIYNGVIAAADSTYTFTNHTSDVPTEGQKFVIYYNKYKTL